MLLLNFHLRGSDAFADLSANDRNTPLDFLASNLGSNDNGVCGDACGEEAKASYKIPQLLKGERKTSHLPCFST
jgi:hypothetical protein